MVVKRLQGKTVLVTGASSGFGREIALTCAVEGADVALVARRGEMLEEVAELAGMEGRRAVICVADVAEEEQVLAAVARAKEELGVIDILVNNAGINVKQRSILDTSSAQWRQLLEVNLTSAFLFTKALLPDMIAQERGTIINLASRAALHPDLTGGVGYSASKMGMDALTQVTNEEGNPHNVRACLFCPGVGNTPILDQRPTPPPPAQRQRMLQPEDIAATIVFIASLPQRIHIELVSMKPTHL
jgi:NADP-dependent 3-hydroxy acid dehydrogenase YdfG